MPSAATIRKNVTVEEGPGVPRHEDVDAANSVNSPQWMREEIERLQRENERLKVAGEARSPGQTFKEQWVRDPDVPNRIMDGDFHDISVPAPGVNAQRMRAPGTFDPTAVSNQLASRMGIDLETHEPCWRRRDNWQNLGVNDVEEFMDHNEGGEVCYSKDGKLHHRGDNVLCKRLKKYGSELVNERINEGARRDALEYPHRETALSEDELIRIREENRTSIGKGILAGSITQGKSLERAGQMHTVEEIQKIKERYLYSGKAKPAPARATVDNAADRLNQQLKGITKGRGGTYNVSVAFDANGNVIR